MPDQPVFLFIVGLVAGVMSGMFGIGGGVIIVPVLILFLSFTTVEAVATSLGALLMPVGIFAVLAYYRAGKIDVKSVGLVAVGLALTSALGAAGALKLEDINPDLLKQLYGLFALYMAWRFAEPRKVYAEWQAERVKQSALIAAGVTTSGEPQFQDKPAEVALETKTAAHAADPHNVPWYVIFMVGLVAGIASGLFGIGGGVVIVPALVSLLHYDQKQAVGTSLGALLLPVGLPGVLVYLNDGVLDIPVAGAVAVGLIAGALIGARIALGLPTQTVKRLYGVFLFFVGLYFIFGSMLLD